MKEDHIQYYKYVDCICIPQSNNTNSQDDKLNYTWAVLDAPFIIIPLEWNYDDNYNCFERELKQLVAKYFDHRLVKDFLTS